MRRSAARLRICDPPGRKATPLLNNPNPLHTAIPTAAQLSDSRLSRWHQTGEALLTIENLRSWINVAGLILYAPRPQIASPAPTLVEAVLGTTNATPTLEEASEARSLLARLIAEGLAVPLNLLGAVNGIVGDTPDFIATPAVFSYIFTLRGDKAWKQPPATSGAVKVSPLALATHEALAKRITLSAYDLATELGKEVTETAVMRALAELWAHLRVIPVPQPDGAATLWELTSARFTKQIKAGANAGQPSALSALISLYLGQSVVATEDEIESFLSPLAARSRIRDVVHALMAARQLETVAVEGRTMLHVAGELPAFLLPESAEAPVDAVAPVDGESEVAGETSSEPGSITKFVPKPKKIGTGYLAKAAPARFGSRPAGGGFGASKPSFRDRAAAGAGGDRERRPFAKPGFSKPGFNKPGFSKPGFDKPWQEEKQQRLAAAARPSEMPGEGSGIEASGEAAPARTYTPRPQGDRPAYDRKPSFGGKPSFGSRPSFGGKPSFGSRPGGRPSFGSDRSGPPSRGGFSARPSFGGDSRPPRQDFSPRTEGGDSAGPRKTFSKPGTFGRKREGGFGDSRPPRRDFGGPPREDRGERPAFRPNAPRAPGSYSPRPQGDRPQRSGGADRGDFAPRKPFAPRGGAGFGGKPSFQRDRPRDGGSDRPQEGRERFTSTESGKRVYRKFDAPRDRPAKPFSSDRPARPFSSDRPARPGGARRFDGTPNTGRDFSSANKPSGGYAGKSSGGYAGKSSGGYAGKSSGGYAGRSDSGPGRKPGGFGGKKPFGSKPARAAAASAVVRAAPSPSLPTATSPSASGLLPRSSNPSKVSPRNVRPARRPAPGPLARCPTPPSRHCHRRAGGRGEEHARGAPGAAFRLSEP